ncbi:hypothetical protein [Variovorax sp. LG9.2]|uniref:hypothetical protein n=1 Tax=Variovorax sp. LG9.2 TaxID=3048626 RepID=UPI002B224FA2|nr:hypothetical protein [Variovorax sp. LG9.2]MEB0058798.1 hypothetical protein [Variovorax sp. LG9.2]
MKKIAFVFAALCIASVGAQARGGGEHSGSSSSSSGSHSISGHTRGNGTYVAPSHATNPNATKADNWSTKGNVNPYTGKPGSK